MDGETPGCILARFELSQATSAKRGENLRLYHINRMFSGNNDRNLNIVPRVQTAGLERKTMKHSETLGSQICADTLEKKFPLVFWSS